MLMLKEKGVISVVIVGYSHIIVDAMVKESLPQNLVIGSILRHSFLLKVHFSPLDFYHVPQKLDGSTGDQTKLDSWAERGSYY